MFVSFVSEKKSSSPKREKGNNKCVGPNLMETYGPTTIEKVRVVERFSFGWPVFSSDSENSHYGTGVGPMCNIIFFRVPFTVYWQFMGTSPNMMYSRSTGFLKFKGTFLVLLSKRYFIQSPMGFLFSTLLQLFDLWRDLSEFLHSLYISLPIIYIKTLNVNAWVFNPPQTPNIYVYYLIMLLAALYRIVSLDQCILKGFSTGVPFDKPNTLIVCI